MLLSPTTKSVVWFHTNCLLNHDSVPTVLFSIYFWYIMGLMVALSWRFDALVRRRKVILVINLDAIITIKLYLHYTSINYMIHARKLVRFPPIRKSSFSPRFMRSTEHIHIHQLEIINCHTVINKSRNKLLIGFNGNIIFRPIIGSFRNI